MVKKTENWYNNKVPKNVHNLWVNGMRGEISKSKYCKGIQCPKILWMDANKPELAVINDKTSAFENGKLVGELARKYFGAECIAEASFVFDGLFCSVDMLRKTDTGYDVIEVKSSSKVSDVYIEDVSYQYYVLVNSDVPIDHIYLMHINTSYVRHGELDLQDLFVMEDYTEKAINKQSEVAENIRMIREYNMSDEEPEKEISKCCEKPYKCAYYDYCRRHLTRPSIFDVRNVKMDDKYQLYHEGIITFEDIVKNKIKLSDQQMMQVETTYYHKPDHIDKEKIKQFIDTLSYPIYHLDFETYQSPIPEYDGMSPYKQIPFQYSIHIEYEDGKLEHKEYLAEAGTDPRRELAERLVRDIPENVCVLVYNMSFEKRVIEELAKQYDDLSEHLLNIRENIHDLMIPFKKHYYYTEAMKGSHSIKYVLPALFPDDPELDYHNLEGIHQGDEASAAFANMTKLTPDEVERVRTNLLKYCGLDTYAMVKVLEKLREVTNGEVDIENV